MRRGKTKKKKKKKQRLKKKEPFDITNIPSSNEPKIGDRSLFDATKKYLSKKMRDEKRGRPDDTVFTNIFINKLAEHKAGKEENQINTRNKLYLKSKAEYERNRADLLRELPPPEKNAVYMPPPRKVREGTAKYGYQYDDYEINDLYAKILNSSNNDDDICNENNIGD